MSGQDPLLSWAVARYEELRRRRRARMSQKSSPSSIKSSSIPSIIFVKMSSDPSSKSKRKGIANYSREENMHFMSIMKRIRPVGAEEWKKVEEIHSKQYKNKNRDFGSLRRKYTQLANKGCPTGDPNVPEDIQLAREVKRLISEKMNLGTGKEMYSLESGYENENIGSETIVLEDEDQQHPPDEIPLGQPSQETQQETQTQIEDPDEAPSFLQPLAPPSSFPAPAKSVSGFSTPSKRSYARTTTSSSIVSSVENIMEVIALSFAKNEKYAEERRLREEKEDRERKLKEEKAEKEKKEKEEKAEKEKKEKEEKEERQRRQDREDAKEERAQLYGVIAALAQGVTTAWTQGAAAAAQTQQAAVPRPRTAIARKRRRDAEE